ncbi:MAG TPA: sensor histidine kinase, partial [Candidatus Limnocylindrales bacterium]
KIAASEFSEDDQELVEMFALHAGIAIQNARLHQRVQQLAIVDERLRISRDLHDGIIQSIYAVSLTLEDVTELVASDPGEAVAQLDRSIDRLHTTIRDIRSFITGLGAGPDVTLADALRHTITELAPDPAMSVELDLERAGEIEGRLAPNAVHELLQIAREALSNTFRHSGATHVRVRIEPSTDAVLLEVADDGRGFDTARRAEPGHMGLANLRDRATAAGGTLDLASNPGRGTRIIFRLPLLDTDPMPA